MRYSSAATRKSYIPPTPILYMDQEPYNDIREVTTEVDRTRYGIISAIDSHERAVRFAGGDVAASEIIQDLEEALDCVDSALVSLRWAENTFEERYL